MIGYLLSPEEYGDLQKRAVSKEAAEKWRKDFAKAETEAGRNLMELFNSTSTRFIALHDLREALKPLTEAVGKCPI